MEGAQEAVQHRTRVESGGHELAGGQQRCSGQWLLVSTSPGGPVLVLGGAPGFTPRQPGSHSLTPCRPPSLSG